MSLHRRRSGRGRLADPVDQGRPSVPDPLAAPVAPCGPCWLNVNAVSPGLHVAPLSESITERAAPPGFVASLGLKQLWITRSESGIVAYAIPPARASPITEALSSRNPRRRSLDIFEPPLARTLGPAWFQHGLTIETVQQRPNRALISNVLTPPGARTR